MMLANKPKAFHAQRYRDTHNLWFADGSQGEFYLHGGLCWPVAVQSIEEQYGCAILAGVNVETGVCHVFEQFIIDSIEPAYNQHDGRVKSPGLASWLQQVHSAYGARRYYFNQDESLHRMYLLQVLRSRIIDPKPVLVPISWKTDEEAMSAMNHWRMNGNLVIAAGTPIERALQSYRSTPGMKLAQSPPLHALACLLVGLTLRPWRKHMQPRDGFRS
jgi:hypothetical protein